MPPSGSPSAPTDETVWTDLSKNEIAQLLRADLGARASNVPTRTAPDLFVRLGALFSADLRRLAPNRGVRREFTSGKAERLLGWRARPAREAVIDGAESLLRAGLAA